MVRRLSQSSEPSAWLSQNERPDWGTATTHGGRSPVVQGDLGEPPQLPGELVGAGAAVQGENQWKVGAGRRAGRGGERARNG